ncbi:MAG: diacylglycerol kinase family protein, partial [Clostridia bacterium]|nr:diacylglycerol kinase family protein [Clostridia bacterium]
PTPAQDRLDPERKLTVMLMHGKGRIGTLLIFPKIFKGEHVKHTSSVTSFTGRDITVKFDRPVAAQVDGETVLNVTEYHITK